MGIGVGWQASDWQNVRDSWLAGAVWNQRHVVFRKFLHYDAQGTTEDETARFPVYQTIGKDIWLSQIKVYDTVKGGYFTTGDLDCTSEFLVQGASAGYKLPNGVVVPENAGDEIIWNGKIWKVADQVDPVQQGLQGGHIYYRTVLRRTDRSGLGVSSGP
jgi:hypothetical protein